jgi:hypothetical protein
MVAKKILSYGFNDKAQKLNFSEIDLDNEEDYRLVVNILFNECVLLVDKKNGSRQDKRQERKRN